MKNTSDEDGFKKILSNNWFIIKYTFNTVPIYALMICLSQVIGRIVIFFEHTYMIKYIIDCIQFKRPFIYAALYILGVFISVSSWLFFNCLYQSKYRQKYKEKLNRRLQLDIFNKAASMDLDCYDNPDYYTDFVWAMSESLDRTDKVLDSINALGGSIAAILISGIFMITMDMYGLLFVVISFISSFFINIKINKFQYDLDVKLLPKKRKRDYINRILYLNDYAKEIRLSDIKTKILKDYDKANHALKDNIEKHTKRLVALSFFKDYIFNSFIIDGLYMIYLIFQTVVTAIISYGTLVALFRSSSNLSGGLKWLTYTLPRFQENSLYINKLRKFLSYEPKIKSKASVEKIPEKLSRLTLKNVSFSYSNMKPILKNINMTINPHEKIAIVGHNGAGKTTLINLLMRLYDVTEGEILYNNVNIKEYDLKNYSDVFGTIFQDYQLFAATVCDNVAMDYRHCQTDKIKDALKQSGFSDKLATLKNDVNTILTREFDDEGVELSKGEAQKIALARVFYKPSDIIILDEPSSALDPISEYHLNKTIYETAKDKTVIFISHRLSTTNMADKVYLLENGEIIEQGSHDELMELNAKYAYMFNLQARKYQIENCSLIGTR